jgi:small subunit ribosomal protein S21
MSYHKYYRPEEHTGVCVVRRRGETDEEFFKRFRKKFSKSGVSKEFRDRMYYEKPSDKRRRKKMQSLRAIKREEEKLQKLKEKLKRKRNKNKKLKNKKGKKHDKSS